MTVLDEPRATRGLVPSIAVVIPTRDRGDSVRAPLRSLLAGSYRDFEIVVIDQSSNGDTAAAVASFSDGEHVRYLASDTRGLSRALNAGIAACSSEIIAITGDDCTADSEMLDRIASTFAKDPRVGIVFGNVYPGAHDAQKGFVQAYVRTEPAHACSLRFKHLIGGTSACMALRRHVWQAVYGFDPALGVGAPLLAAEETDFALRALQLGFCVLEEPTVAVTHEGFKEWSELEAVIDRNWFGTGAAVAKLIRQAPAGAIEVTARMAINWAFRTSGVAATLGPGGYRWRRMRAFARGLFRGLRHPLDPNTGLFSVPYSI